MGILGLTTLINNNPHLLRDYRLHDNRVVIDGNSLYHFLYYNFSVPYHYGGDYKTFTKKIVNFFEILKSCNVSTYVVLDGGYDTTDKKLRTTLDRARTRLHLAGFISHGGSGRITPILSRETFCRTLRDLKVPHVVCEFEADDQIAVLANSWQCPVMSSDSDFYIFDLPGGFLSFDNLDLTVIKSEVTESEKPYRYLSWKLYHTDNFVQMFKGLDKAVLPLFATICGNDFVNRSAFERVYARLSVPKHNRSSFCVPQKHTRMLSLLHWLETVTNSVNAVEQIIHMIKPEKQDHVRNIIAISMVGYTDIYKFHSINLQQFFESDSVPSSEMGFSTSLTQLKDTNKSDSTSVGQSDMCSNSCPSLHLHKVNDVMLSEMCHSSALTDQKDTNRIDSASVASSEMFSDYFPSSTFHKGQAGVDNEELSEMWHGSSSSEQDKDETINKHDVSNEVGTVLSVTTLAGPSLMERKEANKGGVFSAQGCLNLGLNERNGDDNILLLAHSSSSVIEEKEGNKAGGVLPSEVCTHLCLNERSGVVPPSHFSPPMAGYNGGNLPQWFVMALCRAELPSFMQNVVVLHRIVLQCQVEDLVDPSAYLCSRSVRQVIYGILMSTDPAPSSCSEPHSEICKKCHIEEYDRDVKNHKKNYISPINEISGVGRVPSLQMIPDLSMTERRQIMLQALQMSDSVLVQFPPNLQLVAMVIIQWLRCSNPKVTTNHIKALIVSFIYLGLKQHLVRQNSAPVYSESHVQEDSLPTVDIAHACSRMSAEKIMQVRTNLEKFCRKPEYSKKKPVETPIIHGFCQFQACLLDSLQLNQLLCCPFHNPNPSQVFYGTFLYSFCKELHCRLNPVLFISEMLIKHSPLADLYNQFMLFVLGMVEGQGCFLDPTPRGKKNARKKAKRAEKSARKSASSEDTGGDEHNLEAVDIVVACEITNRFVSLGLDGDISL